MPTTKIVIVGLCALAIAMGIGRFAYTPLLPMMQNDGLVSIENGGLLASVHFLGYWLGAVYAAKLPYSPKSILRFSLLAIGISTLGMGVTDSFVIWSILRWLAGLCSAFTLVLVSNFYIKHLTEMDRADKHGMIFSGVGAGIVVAGLGTLALMIGKVDSSTSWLIFGVLSLVSALIVSFNIGTEISNTPPVRTKSKSARTPLIWSIIIPYGALGIGYIIPATYLPVMARDIVPSPMVFGWAWPIFGATAFLSTLVASRLQKIYSIRMIWVVSQIIMAIGLLLPALYPHIVTIILAGISVGGTFMIITMMGMKEVHRIAPSHDIMRHLGAMTAAFAGGQMIGPMFASWIYGLTQSFSTSLIFASLILVATLLALAAKSANEEPMKI
ncbi:MAG: YbfB/YjiJ family MFS transporter [Rhizobiaceae bacterium]|nr:YbfB/YjiJ family MFS transporter [Rhizobiaceae bacterium]